jgi:hypothetical protein
MTVGRLLRSTGDVQQTRGVTEEEGQWGPEPSSPVPKGGATSRLARARASFAQAARSLLRPEGLPAEAAAQLEAAFGRVGREVITAGPGRLRRVRAQIRAAPPRLLDWMSGQVLEHPAVLYDHEGVELLASRQTRSIATAMGALQLALVAAAAASTLEGGPLLALAIDGAVGQMASVVHGFCDWYNTGSYLVRRLNEADIAVDRAEVRRLTNAALMSRGKAVDPRALDRSTELRLIRSWVGRGLVDALPFGSTLGRASPRAAARIDHSDLAELVRTIRAAPG